MSDIRRQNIAAIQAQFDATKPITQEVLDDMIARRRANGMSDEQLQKFLETMMVGKTLIYFLSEGESGRTVTTQLTVMKHPFMTVDEAVVWFDEYGDFVENTPSGMPRIKPRTLQL